MTATTTKTVTITLEGKEIDAMLAASKAVVSWMRQWQENCSGTVNEYEKAERTFSELYMLLEAQR